jgi:predicted permease
MIWPRVKALIKRRQLDRDLEEELSFHLALREARYAESGIAADDARAVARREFGNATGFKEACRDMWTFVSLENSWQDLRFAIRTFRKEPGFTAMAVLSLALGIGANSAVFTLTNDLLLKAIPVQDPRHLVSLGKAEGGGVQGGISGSLDLFPYQLYKQIENRREVFAGVCAYGSFPVVVGVRPGGSAGPMEQATSSLVSGDFFHVLGVTTILGHAIEPSDADAPGRQAVAVISYDYWRQNFSGDPAVIGRSIILNGTLFTVIGVAPPKFYGIALDASPPDMWLPLSMQQQAMLQPTMLGRNGPYWLHMMARLRPGVGMTRAQEWLKLELRRYMTDSEGGTTLTADRRQEIQRSFVELVPGDRGVSSLRGQYEEPLRILMGIVGLVLLIACANLANFFLAKMATREKEIATRLALGAGASRIVRQMLTETLLLSFFGGAVGLLFAAWGTRALIGFVVGGATRTPFDPSPDLRVLAFTFGVSLATGLLFGLAPAWRATRMNLAPGLKASSRSVSGEGIRTGRFPLSKVLLTTQVALSLVLLVGAGLFVRTLRNLDRQPFGFNRFSVLEAKLDLRLAGYRPEQLNGLYQRLLGNLNALPGIRSASLSAVPPISDGSWNLYIFRHGQVAPSQNDLLSSINSVTPGYFETSGTRLLAGRAFGPQDAAGSKQVVVVNQTMANLFFPHGDALGKYIIVGGRVDGEWEVVGVVKDGKYNSPRERSTPMVFLPLRQLSGEDLYANCLLLRTAGDPHRLAGELRQALARIARNIPILEMTTLSEQVHHSMAHEELVSRLSMFFALLALLLACIGLYGVMSYNVVRRANEIGIRIALGAEPGAVLWLVLRETLVLLAIGIAIGVPATLAATRLVQSQLFGLSPFDPATVAVAMLAILLVTVIAGYLPARRATKVDPLVALRYE